MAVLSCLKYKTIPTSCVEYVHPWTDSCIDGTLALFIHAFKYCLRTYIPLYLVTTVLRRKKLSKKLVTETLINILQSSMFLTTNSVGYSSTLCLIRRATGTFNLISSSLIPGFVASMIAIQVERPSRRPILCLYVTNVATETLFRMAVSRGLITPIKYGQVLIFMLSSTALMYLFKEKHSDDNTFSLIRYCIGKDEEYNDGTVTHKKEKKSKVSNYLLLSYFLQYYKTVQNLPKSSCCPHTNSCLSYCLEAGGKMFAVGLMIQTALSTVFSIRKIARKPSILPKVLFNKETLNLGLFLGSYSAIFRGVCCLLRWTTGDDKQNHAILAGLLAGTAFKFYPSNTAALYVMWKTLQIIYMKFVRAGYLVELPWAMMILYSFSTAILFHAALLEPKNLRPAYMKFLEGLSGGRIVAMDRLPLDHFGLDTSKNLKEVLSNLKMNPNPRYSFRCFGNIYPQIAKSC